MVHGQIKPLQIYSGWNIWIWVIALSVSYPLIFFTIIREYENCGNISFKHKVSQIILGLIYHCLCIQPNGIWIQIFLKFEIRSDKVEGAIEGIFQLHWLEFLSSLKSLKNSWSFPKSSDILNFNQNFQNSGRIQRVDR